MLDGNLLSKKGNTPTHLKEIGRPIIAGLDVNPVNKLYSIFF